MSVDNSVRLNKYISESGICSRREADKFIEQGHVFINGKRATVGQRVFPGDRVRVNGHNIEPRGEEDLIFIAYNKPVGVTSTTEEGVEGNIVQHVNHSQRIFPIGRLDKDSQGLIFLTNNGDIVNKILRAGNQHEKEYVVTVNKPVTDEFITGMTAGVPILGQRTKRCKIRRESTFVFNIILIQGLNRQIRRMCEYFGYEVTKLERVRIMNVRLKGLPLGEWRELTPEEQKGIFSMIKDSSSTEEASRSKASGTAKNKPSANQQQHNKDFRRKKPASGAKPSSRRSDSKKNSGKPSGRNKRSNSGSRGKGRR